MVEFRSEVTLRRHTSSLYWNNGEDFSRTFSDEIAYRCQSQIGVVRIQGTKQLRYIFELAPSTGFRGEVELKGEINVTPALQSQGHIC